MTQPTLSPIKIQTPLHQLQQDNMRQHSNTLPSIVYSASAAPTGSCLSTSLLGLRPASFYLRSSTSVQASHLVDIAATDKLCARGRFGITYQLLSTITNRRVCVKVNAEETTTIPSLAAPFVNKQRVFAGAS